jgi:hypothetical protein
VLHTAADGNGPVNALDSALRKALGAFYPQLDAVHLVDYKVRILDSEEATGAQTRVIIDSSNGTLEWSTMGSGTNIIAASCQALCDSLEFAIWKTGAEVRRRDERHFTTAAPANGAAGAARAKRSASPVPSERRACCRPSSPRRPWPCRRGGPSSRLSTTAPSMPA